MSFFIRGNHATGSKFSSKGKHSKLDTKKKTLGRNKRKVDLISGSAGEEIPSDDEIVENNKVDDVTSSEDEETAQEKRLKLAKKYLEEIEIEEQNRADAKEIDKDVIAHRLKEDVLEHAGKLQRKVAGDYEVPDVQLIKVLRGHQLSITCLAVSSDNQYVFTGSKDCSIIKWSLIERKKLKVIHGGRKGTEDKHIGHTSHVLCLAISTDNKYLASGCRSNIIHIWNPNDMSLLHTFKGHRGPVSGLTFRKGHHQLYSASHDRSVKVWNVDEMAYVETLFGHQDSLTSIDSLSRERAVTSGGLDNSIRVWKIVEESQLVFQGHKRSIDCVRLINEEHFFSCSDDGSVALWGVLKKKPLAVVENSHGVNAENNEANWIICIATLRNTDLVASGSNDGYINLWKCSADFKHLTLIFKIPVEGFVNSLEFTSDGKYLIAGIGQEHRLGRWWRMKKAKNSILIIPLNVKKEISQ